MASWDRPGSSVLGCGAAWGPRACHLVCLSKFFHTHPHTHFGLKIQRSFFFLLPLLLLGSDYFHLAAAARAETLKTKQNKTLPAKHTCTNPRRLLRFSPTCAQKATCSCCGGGRHQDPRHLRALPAGQGARRARAPPFRPVPGFRPGAGRSGRTGSSEPDISRRRGRRRWGGRVISRD